MSRRLGPLLIAAALAAAPRGWGQEPAPTPVIRFGNPAHEARISVKNARLSPVSGARINRGGVSARVDFAAADWPSLTIQPAAAPADWSGVRALAIPVDNPTEDPVDLVLRVD